MGDLLTTPPPPSAWMQACSEGGCACRAASARASPPPSHIWLVGAFMAAPPQRLLRSRADAPPCVPVSAAPAVPSPTLQTQKRPKNHPFFGALSCYANGCALLSGRAPSLSASHTAGWQAARQGAVLAAPQTVNQGFLLSGVCVCVWLTVCGGSECTRPRPVDRGRVLRIGSTAPNDRCC